MSFPRAVILVLALLVAQVHAGAAGRPIVIEHVTVLPQTRGGAPLPDMTVSIRDGRIASIAPTASASRPKGAQRVNGRGKWLMPGFSDMHMHLENDRVIRLFTGNPNVPDGTIVLQDALTPYLANGVTQIFELSSMSETIGQRVEVESGRVLGPHIATAAMIDGSPPMWPLGMTRAAATPDDGRQAVRDAAAEGYEFIKVYSRLDLETFTAMVDEARKHKMRVLGHIPQREKNLTAQFFQPGFDLVSHAEEFAQQTQPPAHDAIASYVEMSKRNGTWLIGTLTLDERLLEETRDPDSLKSRAELRYLPPAAYDVVMHDNRYVKAASPDRVAYLQKIVDFNRALVRAFAAAGVPVLTGTDSPVPGIVPGFSLHDEFVALSQAGMSNQQVLESTTRLPAEWLGVAGDRGTVEAGKRADLVLLDADPLVDIKNTRRIAAVIVGGRYLPRADLDARLRDLATRYEAARKH
jgi:imidazolonepropionase-like amidohydrolase